MPMKDHAREIWCVTAVANLLRHQANKLQEEENEVRRLAQEEAERQDMLNRTGMEYGAW